MGELNYQRTVIGYHGCDESVPRLTIWRHERFVFLTMKTATKYAEPPRTRRELKQLYDGVIREMKAMSSKELFATMVEAGIYTKSGKLRKEYGGTA